MNEDDVIKGVTNYLKEKLSNRDDIRFQCAEAKKGEHGVDILFKTYSGNSVSNRYYIEAKGTLKAKDDSKKKSKFETEFRWAISQIILRMKEFSGATTYGIAVPMTEKEDCLRLMRNNKGLKLLKIRLYLAYKTDSGEYHAEEMKPSDIYK